MNRITKEQLQEMADNPAVWRLGDIVLLEGSAYLLQDMSSDGSGALIITAVPMHHHER